jgi:hypothetical protein
MSQKEFQRVKVIENAAGGPFATVLARCYQGWSTKGVDGGSVGAGGSVF